MIKITITIEDIKQTTIKNKNIKQITENKEDTKQTDILGDWLVKTYKPSQDGIITPIIDILEEFRLYLIITNQKPTNQSVHSIGRKIKDA